MKYRNQKEIDSYLQQWVDVPDEELLILKKQTHEEGSAGIAVDILLHRRACKNDNSKHIEVITVTRKSARFAKWAVIIGALSLLAFLGDCAYRYFHPRPDAEQKIEELKTKPKEQSSTKEIDLPPIVPSHKPQGGPTTIGK